MIINIRIKVKLFQEAPHPAIIEKEVFDKVQEILGENKKLSHLPVRINTTSF